MIGVITNPNSRKNKQRKDRFERLKNIVGDLGVVRQTPNVDAIKPVLREFLRDDLGYWVADGGDGALHCMLRAGIDVLQEKEFKDKELPIVLPTNGGTIDFVAKNVGIKGNAQELIERLVERISEKRDVAMTSVESMAIHGIVETNGCEECFETIGFAAAVGGVGQRFFEKYYASKDPRPREIIKVVSKTLSSYWLRQTPLKRFLSSELESYADDMLKPTPLRLIVDQKEDPRFEFSGIHIASMGVNLGNVFRVFNQANHKNTLHAIYGSPAPADMMKNLHRLYLGQSIQAKDTYDGPCQSMSAFAREGQERLAPIIDGEYYRNIKEIHFTIGKTIRVAKIKAHLYE